MPWGVRTRWRVASGRGAVEAAGAVRGPLARPPCGGTEAARPGPCGGTEAARRRSGGLWTALGVLRRLAGRSPGPPAAWSPPDAPPGPEPARGGWDAAAGPRWRPTGARGRFRAFRLPTGAPRVSGRAGCCPTGACHGSWRGRGTANRSTDPARPVRDWVRATEPPVRVPDVPGRPGRPRTSPGGSRPGRRQPAPGLRRRRARKPPCPARPCRTRPVTRQGRVRRRVRRRRSASGGPGPVRDGRPWP